MRGPVQDPVTGHQRGARASFGDLSQAFENALGSHQHPAELCYEFAGLPVRLRLVGDRLADLVPRALAHLRVPFRPFVPEELRIDLWDESATGIGCEGCLAEEDLERDGDTDVSSGGRFVVITRAQTRTGFDRVSPRIVGWVGAAERLTQYEVGRPLHSELLLWHRDRGLQPVHAGLIGHGGNGLLIGGPGGSGKSTTALTCLLSGLDYLSDDYVALELPPSGTVIGHSVFCSTHVEPEHLQRFPRLKPHALPGRLAREDKSLILLSDVSWASLARSVRIRAVVLPTVTHTERTRYRPMSRAQALLRLAPSSLMLLPFPEAFASGFRALSTLIDRVPVLSLELGEDLDEIPRVAAELLEKVGR